MDLDKVFKNASEELAKEKQAVAEQAEQNRIDAENNKIQSAVLRDLEAELKVRETIVKSIEDVEALKKETDARIKAVEELELTQKREQLRLKKEENRLVEIKDNLDKREEKLKEETIALVEREKTYKEELQTNFVKNFMSKLLV